MILIDGFPFDLSATEIDDYQLHIIPSQGWLGPTNPEVEAQRIQSLKDSWTEARRIQASIDMKNMHPMPRTTLLSKNHKENIGKSMMGNQNKRGKRGGNQHTKAKL